MSADVFKTPEMIAALEALLVIDGPERGGFILSNGEIVECDNQCPEPMNGYIMSGGDIARYADDATALWHTHPRGSANLSVEDHDTFVNWPGYTHIIIGSDGVRFYKAKGKGVVNA